jgi:hypothetical protein
MVMTDTIIVGDIGIGGLGYVNAILISRPNSIHSPIRLCVDTGSSVTIISHLDALRIGLDYDNKTLQKSKQQTLLDWVGAFRPYILPDAEILFNSQETSLLEYVGNIHVMPPLPSATSSKTDHKSDTTGNQMSLLGIDVLKKFTISFSQNSIILCKQ